MDLAKLGEAYRKESAPAGFPVVGENGTAKVAEQVARVRELDVKEREALRRYLVLARISAGIWILLAAAMAVVPLVDHEADLPTGRQIGFLTLAIIFTVHLFVGTRKRRTLARIDYSAPVGEFLRRAEERYRLTDIGTLAWAVPLLVLLAVGMWPLSESAFGRLFPSLATSALLTLYVLFFLLVTALGSLFTYLDWRKEKRIVWLEIRRMRRDAREKPDESSAASTESASA